MLPTKNLDHPARPPSGDLTKVGTAATLAITRFLLASALLLVPGSSVAQIMFERTYGGEWFDEGHSVQQTGDGGYIIAGTSNSYGALSNDVYLVKTDSLGNIMWSRMYGGDRQESGWSVDQTSDSGFVVAAVTQTHVPDSADVYLIKTDSTGGVVWEKTYGGVLLDHARCVRQTIDGGYIIAGWTTSFGFGGFDAYLVKTDCDGEIVWERTYGGSLEDFGYSTQQTLDGGYVIVGGTTSFGMGDQDIYFVKTDSLGNRTWSRTYGGISSESARSVEQTDDGGFIICGYTRSFGEGESDIYLVRTDSMGYAVWSGTYGGTSWEYAECVRQTQDGGYVLVGRTSSYAVMNDAVYIVKTDSIGDTLWTRTYGSRDSWGYGIEQTPDGGYIVAGYYDGIPPQLRDVYLIKTNENGVTGVQDEHSKTNLQCPAHVVLRNTPNPFDCSTVISYSLTAASAVRLTIWDVTGRLVETLVNEPQQSGIHQVRWNRRANPSGVYFYRLKACPERSPESTEGRSGEPIEPWNPELAEGRSRRAGEFIETRKMVVID